MVLLRVCLDFCLSRRLRDQEAPSTNPWSPNEDARRLRRTKTKRESRHGESSEFADYIVYLGENGPSFKASPTEAPAYALTFCIFGKKRFAEETATALQCLKFDYFGHDQVIFDHRDVLKREGDFRDVPESSRKGFLDAMVGILERSDMSVIEVVVRG